MDQGAEQQDCHPTLAMSPTTFTIISISCPIGACFALYPTACRSQRRPTPTHPHRQDQKTPDILYTSSRNWYDVLICILKCRSLPTACWQKRAALAACDNANSQDTPRSSAGTCRPCKNARMNSSPFSFGMRPRISSIIHTPTMKMIPNAQPSGNRYAQ
jgi:hypothetical protein